MEKFSVGPSFYTILYRTWHEAFHDILTLSGTIYLVGVCPFLQKRTRLASKYRTRQENLKKHLPTPIKILKRGDSLTLLINPYYFICPVMYPKHKQAKYITIPNAININSNFITNYHFHFLPNHFLQPQLFYP